nr:protein ROOT PRIMORDIUM DEFECTIVE 1 [Ipomoea batatas]
MAIRMLRKLSSKPPTSCSSAAVTVHLRCKTTSAEYVASRARDITFEKLMEKYKNLFRVIAIQDLILASRSNPRSVSVDFLNRLSQRLHLNRGATAFLRRYPHIFRIFYHTAKSQPYCALTETALEIARLEAQAIDSSLPLAVERLVRVLSMSLTKTVPLRAIFKLWKELGLPDDFESSVIAENSHLFALDDGNEPNTHVLKLVTEVPKDSLVASVENWRIKECCGEDCSVDRTEILYSFKHSYPPGMRLKRDFKAKVKEWQGIPYIGPYEEYMTCVKKKMTKRQTMAKEKRAVGIVHEFLSLTVEKTVEVEKISHFRKWFGIDLNIRDLFLDHPGMFYLSTKGYRHTVFLREAYERGCLIEPNPVYDARRKLLHLVAMGHRGMSGGVSGAKCVSHGEEESELEEVENN